MEWYVNEPDIAILRILDGLRFSYEYIKIDKLKKRLPYSEELILESLKKLEKLKCIKFWNNMVKISEKGRDTLAVWDFKVHKEIDEIGNIVGVGKEAQIVSAFSQKYGWCVIKFHKYNRKEFEKFKKSYSYSASLYWGSKFKWHNLSKEFPRLKARVEWEILNLLYKNGFPVPEPIQINRHAILMKMITWDKKPLPAPRLFEVELENPEKVKEEILFVYKEIVKNLGIIHGDFSEFNVLINKRGKLFFIDWPQAIPKTVVFAKDLLERDIRNIKNFFKRKYSI